MTKDRIARRARQLRLLAGGLLFLALFLELISYFAVRALASRDPPRQEMYWARSDAYRGEPWVDEYLDDYFRMRLRWEPYVYWRRRPFSSRFIHVNEEGLRRTVPGLPGEEGRPAPRIFVFGGSTAWGEGARDEATIPSCLSRALAERGVAAEVANFAEGGYVSTQEMLCLARELQRGNVPDVAVFYHGLNDMYSAAQSGEAGIPQNEWNRRAEFNLCSRQIQLYRLVLLGPRTGLYTVRLLYRLAGSVSAPRFPALDEQLAQAVADAYLSNVRAIRAMAGAHGFAARFYWQPVLYNKPDLTPFERELKETQPEHFEAFFARVDALIREAARDPGIPDFRYLGGLFAGDSGPLYIDFSHISEAGNDRVAERIADDLAAAAPARGIALEPPAPAVIP